MFWPSAMRDADPCAEIAGKCRNLLIRTEQQSPRRTVDSSHIVRAHEQVPARQAGDMSSRQTISLEAIGRLSPNSRTCIERLLQYEPPATIE